MDNEKITIRNLLPRHNQIINLILEGTMNYKQIAATVGVSPVTVKNIKNSPTIQHELAVRRQQMNDMRDELVVRNQVDEVSDAREVLNKNTRAAAQKLVDILNFSDDRLQRLAANDILDRAGVPRVSKSDNVNRSAVLILDAESAALIKETFDLDRDSISESVEDSPEK